MLYVTGDDSANVVAVHRDAGGSVGYDVFHDLDGDGHIGARDWARMLRLVRASAS